MCYLEIYKSNIKPIKCLQQQKIMYNITRLTPNLSNNNNAIAVHKLLLIIYNVHGVNKPHPLVPCIIRILLYNTVIRHDVIWGCCEISPIHIIILIFSHIITSQKWCNMCVCVCEREYEIERKFVRALNHFASSVC